MCPPFFIFPYYIKFNTDELLLQAKKQKNALKIERFFYDLKKKYYFK